MQKVILAVLGITKTLKVHALSQKYNTDNKGIKEVLFSVCVVLPGTVNYRDSLKASILLTDRVWRGPLVPKKREEGN